MKRARMIRTATRAALLAGLAAIPLACAPASKAPPRAAESNAPAQAYGQQAPASPPGAAQPEATDRYAPPPPPAPGTAPGQGGGAATSRTIALRNASSEIETSQRELDVAAGDCRNACRALGSMDRAAGKVCELAQGEGEGQRCDDARRRVYSARDRVKATCGGCPGGASVERTDPIPSLR